MRFPALRSVILAVLGIVFLAGCELGLEQSANRYEQLNLEMKKLLDVLRQITDEASAKAHQAELEESGEELRDIQARILAAAEKKAKEGGGMGRLTNYRQASIFQQTGDSARRQVERIREADSKAGDILDKALSGVQFPEPPESQAN